MTIVFQPSASLDTIPLSVNEAITSDMKNIKTLDHRVSLFTKSICLKNAYGISNTS